MKNKKTNKEKIADEIENIEQLGADARYYYNYDDLNKLLVEIDSIIWWCKSIKRRLKKEGVNNDR